MSSGHCVHLDGTYDSTGMPRLCSGCDHERLMRENRLGYDRATKGRPRAGIEIKIPRFTLASILSIFLGFLVAGIIVGGLTWIGNLPDHEWVLWKSGTVPIDVVDDTGSVRFITLEYCHKCYIERAYLNRFYKGKVIPTGESIPPNFAKVLLKEEGINIDD